MPRSYGAPPGKLVPPPLEGGCGRARRTSAQETGWSCRWGLNPRPRPYQGRALPLSHGSNGIAASCPRMTGRFSSALGAELGPEVERRRRLDRRAHRAEAVLLPASPRPPSPARLLDELLELGGDHLEEIFPSRIRARPRSAALLLRTRSPEAPADELDDPLLRRRRGGTSRRPSVSQTRCSSDPCGWEILGERDRAAVTDRRKAATARRETRECRGAALRAQGRRSGADPPREITARPGTPSASAGACAG